MSRNVGFCSIYRTMNDAFTSIHASLQIKLASSSWPDREPGHQYSDSNASALQLQQAAAYAAKGGLSWAACCPALYTGRQLGSKLYFWKPPICTRTVALGRVPASGEMN